MASFLDVLAPGRVPDPRGANNLRPGPAPLPACICEDIEILLNTRCLVPRRPNAPEHEKAWATRYPELAASGFCFGIYDHDVRDEWTDGEWRALADEIKAVVVLFEPRLTDVNVEPRSPTKEEKANEEKGTVRRHITFDITARLAAGGPGRAEFVGVFKRGSGRYDVEVK